MGRDTDHVREVAHAFDFAGDVVDLVPHGGGHINDTYVVATGSGDGRCRYTLQKINGAVFPRPDLVMHNIRLVTETIKKKTEESGDDPECGGLSLMWTRRGEHYLVDEAGDYWRCYRYVEGITYDQVASDLAGAMIAHEAARAFARFQRHLDEVDVRDVHVTIEGFHDTPARFRRLCEAAAENPVGRARAARREIEFALAREPLCRVIVGPLWAGDIPTRVTHNDTKINNVVFDGAQRQRPRALCVIDLDTVMPGSSLFDFGDLVRSSACPLPEDETDLGAVAIDLGLFEALTRGYLAGAREKLIGQETALLARSGMVITFEAGLRFLTDFLVGDVYFKTRRADQNLDRARTQFALLRSMERKRSEMEEIVGRYAY
jgi:hypothetical protein